MPGVSEKDLSVTLENNILTIEGMVSTSMYEGLSPRYTDGRVEIRNEAILFAANTS